MTCDTEEHSIEKNTLDDEVVPLVHKQGLPRLLNLFEKHNIKSTFFFTGYYSERSPESLLLVKNKGHEVGCHSYSHDPKYSLDRLSYFEQVREITKAKKIIENIVGEIESFRAPALRINKYTFEALITCGFRYDSSVCPKRFDGPFSSGFQNKIYWLKAKEGVHKIWARTNKNKGKSIIEVPITARFLPYISNMSRISPTLMNAIRPYVFSHSQRNNLPIVFLTHPNECLDVKNPVTTRRSKRLIDYILSDLVRHKLKLRNMGKNAVTLLEKEIIFAKERGLNFKTVNQMRC